MAELQKQLDDYRHYYNTEREHQALAGKTPQEAWEAMPVATAPVPPAPEADAEEPKVLTRTISASGVVRAKYTKIMLGREYAGQTATVLHTSKTIMIFDAEGTELRTVPTPAEPGTYIGNNKPRGFMAYQQPSSKS